jgi:hypothetical protein
VIVTLPPVCGVVARTGYPGVTIAGPGPEPAGAKGYAQAQIFRCGVGYVYGYICHPDPPRAGGTCLLPVSGLLDVTEILASSFLPDTREAAYRCEASRAMLESKHRRGGRNSLTTALDRSAV